MLFRSCTAVFSLTNSWSGGFQASVTVTAGSSAITGWSVAWTFPPGEAVTELWSGSYSVSGQAVTVTNESYNGALNAGANTSFGFTGSDPGAFTAPASLKCTAVG